MLSKKVLVVNKVQTKYKEGFRGDYQRPARVVNSLLLFDYLCTSIGTG